MVKGELAKSKLENVNDYSLVISPSPAFSESLSCLGEHHSQIHHPPSKPYTAHNSRIHRHSIVFENHKIPRSNHPTHTQLMILGKIYLFYNQAIHTTEFKFLENTRFKYHPAKSTNIQSNHNSQLIILCNIMRSNYYRSNMILKMTISRTRVIWASF